MLNFGAWRLVQAQRLLVVPAVAAVVLASIVHEILRPLSIIGIGDASDILVGRVVAAILSVVLPACLWTSAVWLSVVMADQAWATRPVSVLTAANALLARRPSAAPAFMAWALLVGFFMSLNAVWPPMAWILAGCVVFTSIYAVPAYLLDGLRFDNALRFSWALTMREPGVTAKSLLVPISVWAAAAAADYLFWYLSGIGVIFSLIAYGMATAIAVVHIVGVYRRSLHQGAPQGPLALRLRRAADGPATENTGEEKSEMPEPAAEDAEFVEADVPMREHSKWAKREMPDRIADDASDSEFRDDGDAARPEISESNRDSRFE